MENFQSEFEKLLEESQDIPYYSKGERVTGVIVRIQDDYAFVDVGQKTEVVIDKNEINGLSEGDQITAVYLGRRNKDGYLVISRRPLIFSEALQRVEDAFSKGEKIGAKLDKKINKGFLVDLGGVKAFLPYSESGLRRDEELPPPEFDVYILRIDRDRKPPGIVVSRKKVLDEEIKRKRDEIFSLLEEGKQVRGRVEKVQENGAVLSLERIVFGFLPRSLYSWDRDRSISELSVGDEIDLVVKSIDRENQKIIFSKRDLEPDPWKTFDKEVGDQIEVEIKDINDFGLIVKTGALEGFIHKSETSHLRPENYKNSFRKGQKVKAKIIELDRENRRLKLSIKALHPHPVDKFLEENPEGSVVEGKIKEIRNKIAFVDLGKDVEGVIHLEDATWNPKIKNIGQVLKGKRLREFKVLGREKDKVRLGIKQFRDNPWEEFFSKHSVGDVIKAKVKKLIDRGAFVDINEDVEGFIPLSEISKEKIEIPSDKLSLGQEIEAKIIKIKGHDIILSIKALEKDKEKKEIEEVMRKVKPKGEGLATLGELLKEKLKGENKA
ncbi:MAG TPA: 30S ribosomal protein S1 [Persephonella sp.]|uniref:Ribosomal protein S01 n=1 Tax=Persephonella marina (strain DSM 14350 / EX-H1) TaxID=123214 RepID=C0QT24_PERMH|nr:MULTISPECIES: S1 RNA-binding domain-containing protein [Persephonella]ACO04597.1 ribosomal protein S01 [Persephonella marina EX-H1]HCB70542.1 30S ribosomal protein S1 [Persephonella sp.]